MGTYKLQEKFLADHLKKRGLEPVRIVKTPEPWIMDIRGNPIIPTSPINPIKAFSKKKKWAA